MEFNLNSENIQIIIKDFKQSLSERFYNDLNSEHSNSHLFDISNNNNNSNLLRFDIIIKLEDYYLINNIKLVGDLEDLTIIKIKFQNLNNGLWESALYFNPDGKQLTLINQE